MASQQLNLRLAEDARDALEALAFVRRTTPSALARDIVIAYLVQHANEPGVATALSALAEHDAAETARPADVAEIGSKRDRRER